MLSNAERARILVEALPYIKEYTGSIAVIKYGGNAMTDAEIKKAVMHDIVLLNLIGVKVVLIHGGGPEINGLLKKIGKKSEFVDGLRVTDDETMDAVQMALAGKVNKDLVNLIHLAGGKAVGISGVDGHLLEAEPVDEVHGHVGNITAVNIAPVEDLINLGYIPVISTIACDANGNLYNVNADTAAASIAGALKAKSLIAMTDTAGLLRDKDDASTLISKVRISEVAELKNQGVIQGGMIPKVDSCVEAIEKGTNRVFIIDGRIPHSILIEMLTSEGLGTMFTEG